jgi:glutathione synthase/RimK-type ligase-like ATP-grasp enzyme
VKRDWLFLIVTNKRDLTSDFIVRELRRRKLPFFRLNTEDAPSLTLTHKLGSATMIGDGDVKIDLKNVRAAYFRRPMPPSVASGEMKKASAHYIREEWSYLLRSIYLELETKWFSHPNSIILAEDKPRQLRFAKEVGFNVPETIITNELDALGALFSSGKVVAKPMKQSLFEDDEGPGSVIYTNIVSSISEIDPDALRLAPVIFQRWLEKKYDLRVTVVGEKVFAASIDSQEFEQTTTDWRHSSVAELRHAIFDLPKEIEEACRRIVARLGLRYGAIDLVLDRRGQFWFLECNPNGQWAWIENRTALPIAAAIVDAMESISHEPV